MCEGAGVLRPARVSSGRGGWPRRLAAAPGRQVGLPGRGRRAVGERSPAHAAQQEGGDATALRPQHQGHMTTRDHVTFLF